MKIALLIKYFHTKTKTAEMVVQDCLLSLYLQCTENVVFIGLGTQNSHMT